ncbi:MAG TPA: uroporphyrinogen-III C-methyltransferase [Chthoniobacterales bacterium]|jgi:uroporphyrinogen III methyltransferase/synthase
MSKPKKTPGHCLLVGAGPGDLGLVTLRAKEAIESGDVLIYDYLCNPEMLTWAKPDVEKIYAGKKAGAHTLTQEEINELLVKKTSSGLRVVRLKGGDPFVFGRGGEEALALAGAKLSFEIVPGVSSAIAAPAYAGIPVTHRGMATQVTFFTGHEDPTKAESTLDYEELARIKGTKVMLMGVERLGIISGKLLEHGAAPETPVTLIRWGTTARQETLAGTLGSIAELAEKAAFQAPAIAVMGEVATLRDHLQWFDTRPLFGKRIVVTRSRKQAGVLTKSLSDLGADVIEIPTIRTEPPKNLREFAEMVRDAHTYDWLIFTSPNAVEAFFEMFYRIYSDAREIGGTRIAAVGPSTAKKIGEYHLKVDVQPDEFVPEAIVDALRKDGDIENLRVLIPRAEVTREILATMLTKLGAIVDETIAYRTVPETNDVSGALARFDAEEADLITFTSSSTVENFLALRPKLPKTLKTASIGPVTTQTLRKAGLKADIEATKHDVPGLVAAILRELAPTSATGR